MNDMQIVLKRIDDLIPYENNPRNNDKAVELVANSIREFGFKQPIVIDENNIIVAGHTRWRASKQLGLSEVPCIVASDLTEEQVRAYRLADNKVSEASKWEKDLLGFELGAIQDIDMTAFGFDMSKGKDDEVEADVPFTEVLLEEHNYIVLYFDNSVDWLQAESLFDLKPVRDLSTRKDGKPNGASKVSVGRVIRGKEALESLRKQFGGDLK